MGKVARASTIGKIALGVAGAGLATKEYLKSKMSKKAEPDSKRGGGMVIARGNKLARSKPTKLC